MDLNVCELKVTLTNTLSDLEKHKLMKEYLDLEYAAS